MHLFCRRDVCIWLVGLLYMCNRVVGMLSYVNLGTLLVGMLSRMCIWVFGIWWVGGEEGLSGLLLRLTNRTH